MVKIKDRLGQFIKAHEVKDGDKIVIVNEPAYDESFNNVPLVAEVEKDGENRKFIFNATNEAIATEEFGDETEKWVGKTLVLYKTKVNFKGEIKEGVRIGIQKQGKTRDEKIQELLQKGYGKEHIKQMVQDGLI